jgi:hypothetical protein
VDEPVVGARLLRERPGGDPGVADADEEPLSGVEERLHGLLAGQRCLGHCTAPWTID